MTRNEQQTLEESIRLELLRVGWALEAQLASGPGRINVSGDNMYTPGAKMIVDYVLYYRGIRLAVLEIKAGRGSLDRARLQASQYADKLRIQFSIAANGADWILTDNKTGESESLEAPPAPEEILKRMGVEIDWERWVDSLSADYYGDRKNIRYYQESAISKILWHFGQGHDRALLVMAAGTGKRFTVSQLVWKMMNGGSLSQEHVLYLTDGNNLRDHAYHTFSGFSDAERVVIDEETVSKGKHQAGKVFFASHQTMDGDLDGCKIYETFDADFFDLVVIDDCYLPGFGDWFGVLDHFSSALQLGLTVSSRLERSSLTSREDFWKPAFWVDSKEHTPVTDPYFGKVIYQYSLRQAVDDGFLVPHFLEKRFADDHLDSLVPDDLLDFEKDIRRYDRTVTIAEDLWKVLGTQGTRYDKTIVFCVDDTHAHLMASELCRLAGDEKYACRITPAVRDSHLLEREFALVGSSAPKVAVTVDMRQVSFVAPDVKNIVFVCPLLSLTLYQQMKVAGMRLCNEVDKRYLTIFDYSGVSELEDPEFDGYPVNQKKLSRDSKPDFILPSKSEMVIEGAFNDQQISIAHSDTAHNTVNLPDGRTISFEDYSQQSREVVQDYVNKDINQLLDIWIDKSARQELREYLKDNDVAVSVFRFFLDLWFVDEVDILAKLGFDLDHVPTRRQRVDLLWENEMAWFKNAADLPNHPKGHAARIYLFWQFALDHYALFGIDPLEQAGTYTAPEFSETFGSFQRLTARYGSVKDLKEDLEGVKKDLYVTTKVWDLE